MTVRYAVLAQQTRWIEVQAHDEEAARAAATAALAPGECIPEWRAGEVPPVRQVGGFYVDWVHDPEMDGDKDHSDVVATGVFQAHEGTGYGFEDDEPVACFPYEGVPYGGDGPYGVHERSGVLAQMECDRLNAGGA